MSSEGCQLAVIPAAGQGSRMGGILPKQYLRIHERTILEHTLLKLLDYGLNQIVVAVSEDDDLWRHMTLVKDRRLQFIPGGVSRRESVLRGLEWLCEKHDENKFVMVHDAARPCVQTEELDRLIAEVGEKGIGGLLALPIADTVKRGSGYPHPVVEGTVDRTGLWRALTPQMFRLGQLKTAIEDTLADENVTDEASAMERLGYKPLLVEGCITNIKITYPEDLRLARLLLAAGEGVT